MANPGCSSPTAIPSTHTLQNANSVATTKPSSILSSKQYQHFRSTTTVLASTYWVTPPRCDQLSTTPNWLPPTAPSIRSTKAKSPTTTDMRPMVTIHLCWCWTSLTPYSGTISKSLELSTLSGIKSMLTRCLLKARCHAGVDKILYILLFAGTISSLLFSTFPNRVWRPRQSPSTLRDSTWSKLFCLCPQKKAFTSSAKASSAISPKSHTTK